MRLTAVALAALIAAAVPAGAADLTGKEVFERHCVHCHGAGDEMTGTRQLARTRGTDKALLTERDDEVIGEAVESGTRLFAGVVPGTDGPLSDPGGSVMGVRTLWRRLGLRPGLLPEAVTLTPACGLAGASPEYARRALAHCVRAARSLADNPE